MLSLLISHFMRKLVPTAAHRIEGEIRKRELAPLEGGSVFKVGDRKSVV